MKSLLADFLSKISVAENGSFFIASSADLYGQYEYIYLDEQAFSPLPDERKAPRMVFAYVSNNKRLELLENIKNIELAQEIISNFGVGDLYSYYDYQELLPTYTQSVLQEKVLTQHLSEILLDSYLDLTERYKDVLIKYNKVSDMIALVNFVKSYKAKSSIEKFAEFPRRESDLISEIIKLTVAVHTQPHQAGVTHFFRMFDGFIDDYEAYLNDLIRQKVQNGDFSISIRSVGASTGKEAYSLASILEQSLFEYAMNNVYAHIEDQAEREKSADKWIDLWNVNVYAFDVGFARLSLGIEGLYSLTSQDKDFLQRFPEREKIFDEVYDSILPVSVKIKERLRRWFHPVYCNLDEDLSSLLRNKGEITFAMNLLTYVKHQKDVIDVLKKSGSLGYKSFLSYNESFDEEPVVHDMIKGQPLVIPPLLLPSRDSLILTAIANKQGNRAELADYLGISLDEINSILSSGFNRNEAVNDLAIYDDRADKLVSSFMLSGDIDFDAVNHNEVFKQFIDVEFRNAVKNYVMDLSELKIEPYDITLQLNFFAERVFNAYNGKLKQAGLGQLSDESRNLLNTFLEKIYVLSNGHLFMPQHLEGGTLVEHTYLNLRAFVPMNETEQAEEIITDFVSPQTQQRLVADLNDIRYIANFLSRLDTSVIFSYKDEYDEFKFNTEFSPDGKETALFSIAAASLDFFRQMLSRYESRIKDVYATADIQTLCAHISLLLSEDSSQVENKIDKAVLAEYKKIESDLKKQYFNDGLSVFSREQEHWLDKLELFMDDIIAQKAVNNDLSFSIRTIGASNGQQAYSLAAVLEKSLLKYAENNFFKDDENAEKLAQEWINSWDIKIYAFDENFKRLALVSDGVFNIRSKEKEFFSTNAELSGIFQRGNDTSSLFRRIKPNLRRWIVPVYCNFDGDLSTVKRYPAEVTFAMNVTGYLEYPKELETAIRDSANRSYKSFFVFNNVLSAPPNGFSEPFINSPSNPPSVIEIGNAVIENKLDTQKKLARYFGITQETVNDILSVSAEENITAEKKGFYSLAAKHLVFGLVIRHNGIGNIESDQLIFVNTVFKDYIKNFILSFAVVNMDKTNINLQVSALTNEVLNQYSNLLELNGFSNVKGLEQKLGDTINDFLSSLTIVGNSNIFIPKQINASSYFEYIFVDANPFYPTPENRDKPEVKTELISEKTKDTLVQDMEDARLLRHIVDLFDYRFDLTNYVGEFLPAYDGSHSQYNKLRDNVAHIMLDYIRYLSVNYAAELENFSGDSSFPAFVELIEDILQTDETVRFNDFRDELRDKLTEFKTAIVYPEHVSGIDWDIRKYGRTSFFRNSKNWLADLENYLDDLIVQKVADDDFSISARSIGSATGREAYSLGAVVEQRLLKYARKDIYKDITDETEKEQSAQQWVDKWDVKLYILDISSHRLAVAQEGSYRLLNMEMEFLKKYPEYKDMFAEVIDAGVSEKRPFVALVSDRLKRWAVPVYINLNGDLSPLSRTPSEISFVKNVLYFVKKPSSVINAVLDSTNSAYKSFLGYNHINESPIALSELQKRVSRIEIEGNGHILPPAGKVDAQGVYNLILKSGLSGLEKIAGVLGISEADLSQIYNEQTFRRSVSFVDNYLAESGNGVDLSVFDKMLRKYVIDLSMMMAKEDSEPQEIKKELSAFCEQTLFVFKNRLAQWNIEQSEQQLNEYKNRIADYLSKIIIAPKGHLFVPVIVNGKQMFEHSFIDWQAFLINYDVSKVITELVTEQTKTKIVSDLEDLKYAVQLIESIDIDRLYVDFRQRKNIPFYESNERQLDILTDRIALIALGQFRIIIDKYSDELIKFKGKADMQAFAEYVFDNTKKTDYFQKEQELSPLIDHYISLINAIVPSQQIAPGVTHFFRNSQDWLNQYEMYLNDIIPQKAASGDFTFTLRSVGSSTGKEAYSIMAVLEHELKRYARENIFNNLDAEQREKKVEQWLDIWNITCYAYDNDFTRLASMYEGMYSGLSSLKLFLEKNPDYEDMLDPFFPSFANFVRLNPRLRRWIVPVYADLEGDLTAISRQKAEITFAFNILPYLDSQSNSAKNLQNALFNSSSEIYKSFLAYNVNFEGAPVVSQQMLDGQPMVLPPVRNPSAVRVLTAVLKMDLNSISDLSRYFGIKADQISAILSERTDFQGKDYVFVQHVADDLFSRFADISVDVQSDTEQMDFIYNQYKQFIKDLFVKFTELNVN
ncbi:hypothetical protein J7L67_04450, partial [bacterium]|nr:hypothetical protein [bacterium]